MKIDFSGQTAVVFGAGQGIGEAIAREIASARAKVYVADLIKEKLHRGMQQVARQWSFGRTM